ncbi:MAG: transposase [Candidatus Sulfotelmatobacter sp.]
MGVDFHPEFQQIALVDRDSGEFQEKRLAHREEAEKFYRAVAVSGQTVRVGMEASGHARWFERLLAELQIELRIGDAAEIRAKRVRRQKTDRQDARLILQLLLEDRFPQIWVPRGENRDLRQLLWHRHRMVQARTRIMNQLQAISLPDVQWPGGYGGHRLLANDVAEAPFELGLECQARKFTQDRTLFVLRDSIEAHSENVYRDA